MAKRAVIAEIQKMILTRLYGEGMWLADRDAVDVIDRRLRQLGLQETVPEDPSTTRATALGNELKLNLIKVFFGVWDEYEVPMILMDNGLFDEYELDEIHDRMERDFDPEILLLPIVQNAYIKIFNPSGLHS